MLRKIFSLLLSIAMVSVAAAQPALAKSKEEKRIEFASKVKAGVVKLGTGADTRVEVKLRDKTKLKGSITEIGEEHFVVTDAKTGAATTVAYPDVSSVKGNNLSTGAKIAIGMAIGAGVAILTLFILAYALGD